MEVTIRIHISRGRILLFWAVVLFVVGGILLNNHSVHESDNTTTTPASQAAAAAARTMMTSSAYRCSNFTFDPKQFKSQRGEDKKLLTYFGGLCGGTYVELGALDGVTFSNSHFFNRVLGWKGVLIELGPKNYAKLVQNRRNELAVVHAAICEKRRTVHYVESGADSGALGAVGGIVEFAAESFQDYWWKKGRVPVSEATEIECLPMNDLLGEKLVGGGESSHSFYFDFLSLDVEGAEFEVLKSLDFTKYGFGIILVEADDHDERKNTALRALLVTNGYTQFEPRFQNTDWFVNDRFHSIYGDLLHNNENNNSAG